MGSAPKARVELLNRQRLGLNWTNPNSDWTRKNTNDQWWIVWLTFFTNSSQRVHEQKKLLNPQSLRKWIGERFQTPPTTRHSTIQQFQRRGSYSIQIKKLVNKQCGLKLATLLDTTNTNMGSRRNGGSMKYTYLTRIMLVYRSCSTHIPQDLRHLPVLILSEHISGAPGFRWGSHFRISWRCPRTATGRAAWVETVGCLGPFCEQHCLGNFPWFDLFLVCLWVDLLLDGKKERTR